jgi:hypothetical protein
VLNNQRYTQIDKGYYTLPAAIQNRVIKIMATIAANDRGIFPAGYKAQMAAKKQYLAQTE